MDIRHTSGLHLYNFSFVIFGHKLVCFWFVENKVNICLSILDYLTRNLIVLKSTEIAEKSLI